jgi:hypothetical protein
MEKRLPLAILLCLAFLFVWTQFMGKRRRQLRRLIPTRQGRRSRGVPAKAELPEPLRWLAKDRPPRRPRFPNPS